jgi:hypothetical protein
MRLGIKRFRAVGTAFSFTRNAARPAVEPYLNRPNTDTIFISKDAPSPVA